MSTAVFNRTGQDTTSVEFIQHAESETQVTLRHELLDGEKDYVFGVTGLSVPLQDCPIHPVTESAAIFTIQRRRIGSPLLYEAHPQANLFTMYKYLISTDAALGAFQAFVTAFNNLVGDGNELQDANGNVIDENTGDLAVIQTAFNAHFATTFNDGSAAPLFDGLFPTDDSTFIFTVSPDNPHYSVTDFVGALQSFAELFNARMTRFGLTAAHYGINQNRTIAPIPNPNQQNLIEYIKFRLIATFFIFATLLLILLRVFHHQVSPLVFWFDAVQFRSSKRRRT